MATDAQTRSLSGLTGGRRGALLAYRWLLLAFLLAGGTQIFLAGLAVFSVTGHGASTDSAFSAHRGLGFAMVDHLTRLGIGISSFASVGNKLDVSSNDMLMWWEQDGLTRLAVLYIESFGNPRKFGRTARRVGARLPVLTVHAGRSEAGQQAAASHTAAIASPKLWAVPGGTSVRFRD